MLQTSERISLHARSISLMVLFNNSSVSIHCTSHNYACLPSNFRYNGPPIFQHKFMVNKKTVSTFFNTSMFTLKLVRTCWENWKYALTMHCINIFEIALSNPTPPPLCLSPPQTRRCCRLASALHARSISLMLLFNKCFSSFLWLWRLSHPRLAELRIWMKNGFLHMESYAALFRVMFPFSEIQHKKRGQLIAIDLKNVGLKNSIQCVKTIQFNAVGRVLDCFYTTRRLGFSIQHFSSLWINIPIW